MNYSINFSQEDLSQTEESSPLILNSNSPLPLQYLGGKSRISSWIIKEILEQHPKTKYFFDLFAGSGSVSIAASNAGLVPVMNDIQPYSYCLLKAIFKSKRDNIDKIISLLKGSSEKDLFNKGREKYKELVEEENQYFINIYLNPNKWEEYKSFCEKPEIINNNNQISELKKSGNWDLISNYYSNTYFGVRQCLQLDLIREIAETLEEDSKYQLIGATISAMTFIVSSTTHLAQYLKVSSPKSALNLINKRRINIIEAVISRLEKLSKLNYSSEIKLYNYDYKKALIEFNNQDGETIVYADPPYFKEHYSRYYHLLDTFYLYDYPLLTFNERLASLTTGRYRENRIISNFGLKAKVKEEFSNLFIDCNKKNYPVALSYASTSLVDKEEIIKLAEEQGYKVTVHTKELMHSGQGQKRNKYVSEYLFLCQL